ncbi:hypothetical protein NDU88_003697 [Pleurodeles waltl]|uniref:TERF1-interacting nuclear factor 2 N-terminal domain-containing protein n=1 Tax=Pleurodeles waltl TaxID=8319 RepID=A0AAV7KZQ6_PLEWA|nr:hypothetical protein NDU88_003697 [Pleurodeles waltl]
MTDSGSGRSDHSFDTPYHSELATDSDTILEDNSLNVRLVAAAVWAVVKRRDTEHFGKVLEFLQIVHQQVPDLVFYRHHAKLCAGLKGKLVLDMFEKMRCPLDILKVLDNFFPVVLPEDPFAAPHDLWKVGQCYQEFRNFTFRLIRDDKFRTHYLQKTMEHEYGEKFMNAVEKLLWEFLYRLETVLLAQIPSDVRECHLIEGEQPRTPFLISEPLVPSMSSRTDELREKSKENSPSARGMQAHLAQKVSSMEQHLVTALLEGSSGNKGPAARVGSVQNQKLVLTEVDPVEEQCCKYLFAELTAVKQTTVYGQPLSECASSIWAEDVTSLISDQEKEKIQNREWIFTLPEDPKDTNIDSDQPEQGCEEMVHQMLTDVLSRQSSVQMERVALDKTLQEGRGQDKDYDTPPAELYGTQLMSTNDSDTPELLASHEMGRGSFDKLDVHVPHKGGSADAMRYSISAKKHTGSDVMVTSELHFVQEVRNTNILAPLPPGSSNHLIAARDMSELSVLGQSSSPAFLDADRASTSDSLHPQAVATTDSVEAGELGTTMLGNPSWIGKETGRDTEKCDVSTARKSNVFAAFELDSSLEEIQKEEDVCSPPNPFQSQDMVDIIKENHVGASFGSGAAQQRPTVPKRSVGSESIDVTTVKDIVQPSALTNSTYSAVICKQGSEAGPNLDTEFGMKGGCEVPLGVKSCTFTSTVNTNTIPLCLDLTGIPRTEEKEDGKVSEQDVVTEVQEGIWVSKEKVHSKDQELSSVTPGSQDKTQLTTQASMNSIQQAASRVSELNMIIEAWAKCTAPLLTVSNMEQVSSIASETSEMQTISTASEPSASSEEQMISTASEPNVSSEEQTSSTASEPIVNSEEQTVSTPSETSVSSEEQTRSTASEPSASSEEQMISTASEPSASSEEQMISTASEPIVNSEEQTVSTPSETSVSSEEQTIFTATDSIVNSDAQMSSTATELSVSSEEQTSCTASVSIMNTQHPATNQASEATMSSEGQTGSRTSEESLNCLPDWVTCNVCHGVGAIKRALGVKLLRQRNKIIPAAAEAGPHVKVLKERSHCTTRKRRASKELEGAQCSLHGPSTQLRLTAHADLYSDVTKECISHTTVCAPANLFLHCSQFQPMGAWIRLARPSGVQPQRARSHSSTNKTGANRRAPL